MSKLMNFFKNNHFFIAFIFVVLVAINLKKAVYIDDAFYLEVVKHLINQPT